MPDDRQDRSRVEQHLSGDAAGMRAFFSLMHVLAADREAGHCTHGPLDQDRGNAQRDIDPRILTRSIGDRLDLDEVGRKAVHLPIAGDEFPERHPTPLFPAALAATPEKRKPTALMRGTLPPKAAPLSQSPGSQCSLSSAALPNPRSAPVSWSSC